MLFLNLDGLGRYNDIILTYVCYNVRHCKVHTHIKAWIFLECENLYGWNFSIDVTLIVSSQKNLKTHII